MTFSERAISICLSDFQSGVASEIHVRNVLKNRRSDVSSLFSFIGNQNPDEVRLAAARIAVAFGNLKLVVDAIKGETNRDLILYFLGLIDSCSENIDSLADLFTSDNMIRDQTVDAIKKTGKTELLFPLVFDSDEDVVKRAKKLMNQ